MSGFQAQLESIDEAFLLILGRKPTQSERVDWLVARSESPTIADLGAAIRATDEALERSLDNILERLIGRAASVPLMWLHVPKCGGTSVDLAIRQAIGVPPLRLGPEFTVPTGEADPRNPIGLHSAAFLAGSFRWPFLSGHVGLGAVPEYATVIGAVREPRARLLSLYRWICSDRYRAYLPPEGESIRRSDEWRTGGLDALLREFEELNGGGGMAWQFAAGVVTPTEFVEMRVSERSARLQGGLDRIEALAWSTTEDLIRLISAYTGDAPPVGRENAHTETISQTPTVISRSLLERLDRVLKTDKHLIEAAMNGGKLRARSASDLQEEFIESAMHLNFRVED